MHDTLIGFVRNRYPGDKAVTWCPIKRSSSTCIYNADGSLNTVDPNKRCTRDPLVQISHYTLTLDLYQKTNGFQFWRNVEGCKVDVTETRRIPTRMVNETILMQQSDLKWHAMPWQITVLFFLFLGIFTWLLRYLRNDFCLVCDKNLIFFKDLCFLCRLYGCEKPDPNLVASLRARDEKLRGKDFKIVEAQMVEDMKGGVKKYSAVTWSYMRRKGQHIREKARNLKLRRVFPERAVVIDVEGR